MTGTSVVLETGESQYLSWLIRLDSVRGVVSGYRTHIKAAIMVVQSKLWLPVSMYS